MDIPNLSSVPPTPPVTPQKVNPMVIVIVLSLGVFLGFWSSRLFPSRTSSRNPTTSTNSEKAISADTISGKQDIQINKLYGNIQKTFKDSATGILQKGGINGEGTHYLEREGGVTQRAALTSSTLDLDLFVSRRVEIKGETNSSTKTSWFLDVGSIKVLE